MIKRFLFRIVKFLKKFLKKLLKNQFLKRRFLLRLHHKELKILIVSQVKVNIAKALAKV